MGTQELVNDRVFAQVKRLCYAGLDAATLRQRVVEGLRKAVPFDASAAFTMDPLSGLITDAVIKDMGDARALRFFLEHVYFEDNVLQYTWMIRQRLAVGLLSEATGGKLERALGYRELQSPLGWGHELKAIFAAGPQPWGALCLAREKGRADFVPGEVAVVRRLAPHVGAGLRAAALQEALEDDDRHQQHEPSDDAAGVLILDRQGLVVQHNAAAERRLHELGELGARGREGQDLPEAVWTVVGALKRALRADSDRDVNSAPLVHARGRLGRWLTLQASLTEPTLTRPSEAVVIIAPTGPKEMLGLSALGYGLSPREQEVVDLVVRGASTKEMSQSLFLSEYTVKDHLAHIFEKVGVRGRRALVKRLYLDTIAP